MITNFIAGLMLLTSAQTTDMQLTQVDFALPAQRVTTFAPIAELRITSGQPLSQIAQEAFDRDFAASTYFSAFALAKAGGFGYAIGANSLGAARDMALQRCLTENANCVIVAEIVPERYVPPAPGEIFLRTEAADFFNNPSPDVNNMRSMAISEDGSWAYMWGYTLQAEADAAAIAECELNRSDVPNLQDWPCFLVPLRVK